LKTLGSAGGIPGLSFLHEGAGTVMYSAIGAISILAKIVKPVFGLQASVLHRQNLLMRFRLFVAISFWNDLYADDQIAVQERFIF
jgi:hypothetical protein